MHAVIAAAARAASGASRAASKATVAVSASRFTDAERTPGTERAASSTFATHDAHDMPETCSVETSSASYERPADPSPRNRGSAASSASSPSPFFTAKAVSNTFSGDTTEDETPSSFASFTSFTSFALPRVSSTPNAFVRLSTMSTSLAA